MQAHNGGEEQRGVTQPNENPADVVVVLYTIPVSAPIALTVAPAMTPPELSATRPPIAPRSD